MDIGQKIKDRREQLNLTQDELAKKLGYKSRSSVNKVETSREVSMKKIEEYAKALDTTVPFLMGWLDEPPKPQNATDHVRLIRYYELLTQSQKDLVFKTMEMFVDSNEKDGKEE